MLADVWFRETPVTGLLTVMLQVAVLPPSAVFTVMVAVPPFFAVTRPLFETLATVLSLLLQVTLWFVALLGLMVAVSCRVSPLFMVAEV